MSQVPLNDVINKPKKKIDVEELTGNKEVDDTIEKELLQFTNGLKGK